MRNLGRDAIFAAVVISVLLLGWIAFEAFYYSQWFLLIAAVLLIGAIIAKALLLKDRRWLTLAIIALTLITMAIFLAPEWNGARIWVNATTPKLTNTGAAVVTHRDWILAVLLAAIAIGILFTRSVQWKFRSGLAAMLAVFIAAIFLLPMTWTETTVIDSGAVIAQPIQTAESEPQTPPAPFRGLVALPKKEIAEEVKEAAAVTPPPAQEKKEEKPATAAAPATTTPQQRTTTQPVRRTPVEMPLMYDVRGNDATRANLVVERLVRESLARDPTGNGYIEGSPCSTPNDIYNSVLAYHPDARQALPTVKDLPDFIHVLIPKKARAEGLVGPYELSRMRCFAPGSRQQGDSLDPIGREREFGAEEYVWYHPNFSDPIFAGDCTNVIKPKPRPAAPSLAALPSPCFAYDVDGRNSPNGVKMPLELVIAFYRNASESEIHKLLADQCTYAVDGGTGARLRIDRECALCTDTQDAQQAIWPSDVSVGTKTELNVSVYSADGAKLGFPSGYGTVYVPFWFRDASSLWCFTSQTHYVGPGPAWDARGWQWSYESYYDLVTKSEVEVDIRANAQKLRRIIKPDGVFGK